MMAQGPTSRPLEGPGSAARLAEVRGAFAAAAAGSGRRRAGAWARLGGVVWALYLASCFGVIAWGLDRLYPQVRSAAVSSALARPGLERPFATCGAAHAAGIYNIPHGAPGYAAWQDPDADGLACEPAPRGW